MKICFNCKQEKDESEFGRRRATKDGLSGSCYDCAAARERRWVQNNSRRSKEMNVNWRKTNPEKARQIKRNSILRGDYGLSREDYESILAFQQGLCAICQSPLKVPNVDHNHRTGETRGLLCWHCNNALGKFRDNVTLLRTAADYLERHPVFLALASRRFGLPGRITTSRERRRMLARKNEESGVVPRGSYETCYPEVSRRDHRKKLKKTAVK